MQLQPPRGAFRRPWKNQGKPTKNKEKRRKSKRNTGSLARTVDCPLSAATLKCPEDFQWLPEVFQWLSNVFLWMFTDFLQTISLHTVLYGTNNPSAPGHPIPAHRHRNSLQNPLALRKNPVGWKDLFCTTSFQTCASLSTFFVFLRYLFGFLWVWYFDACLGGCLGGIFWYCGRYVEVL